MGQSGSVISFPACLALQCSSTAQHQPISALDEKEPDLLDDDIESHLEIKAALSGGIAWLITYTARGWMACLGQRKQRREMDGISGPNVRCFASQVAYGQRR